MNWILTRDVQAKLAKAVKLNSLRNDVPLGAPTMAVDFATLDNSFGEQTEDFLPSIEGVQKMAREVTAD